MFVGDGRALAYDRGGIRIDKSGRSGADTPYGLTVSLCAVCWRALRYSVFPKFTRAYRTAVALQGALTDAQRAEWSIYVTEGAVYAAAG